MSEHLPGGKLLARDSGCRRNQAQDLPLRNPPSGAPLGHPRLSRTCLGLPEHTATLSSAMGQHSAPTPTLHPSCPFSDQTCIPQSLGQDPARDRRRLRSEWVQAIMAVKKHKHQRKVVCLIRKIKRSRAREEKAGTRGRETALEVRLLPAEPEIQLGRRAAGKQGQRLGKGAGAAQPCRRREQHEPHR